MNRMTANLILKVFVLLWVTASIVVLTIVLLTENPWQNYRNIIIQLAISLAGSTALCIYVLRDGRRSDNDG